LRSAAADDGRENDYSDDGDRRDDDDPDPGGHDGPPRKKVELRAPPSRRDNGETSGEMGSSAAEAIGDRQPSIAAERLVVHLDAGGRLPALVLGQIDESRDAPRHL